MLDQHLQAAFSSSDKGTDSTFASLTALLADPSLSIDVRLVERLQVAALQEAVRRQVANRNSNEEVGRAGSWKEEDAEKDPYTREVLQALQEEKSRNDVEWERIREGLIRLGKVDPSEVGMDDEEDVWGASMDDSAAERRQEKSLRDKELQVDMLDAEIKALEAEMSVLPTSTTTLAQTIDLRKDLYASINQFDDALMELHARVERERQSCDSDRKLLSDLQAVSQGLERRIATEKEKASLLTPEEISDNLRNKISRVEADLSLLLNTLISTSNGLFTEANARMGAQLRALLDTLMNKAWDTPADPYVDVNRRFAPPLVAFLVRANIALEHPNDSRRLRLANFQLPAGTLS
ncbi:hypothetical protein IE81DRAFT_324882 [Ceraceosorus guamensis]|uniref:Uncharacterized protein n=1 Tax=Ceraceosorus guamensis TaxID=1522189 RepID=A0A316VV51_9BASI|nr:hypothetical protein IE81DRAFT_324882 [Ceraceosorus guamensis]PWN41154.1 hypothetical protein IE81DRAFT_324882 [Ceraceosorus guamensis]